MRRAFCMSLALMVVCACGVQRPLMKPSEIPAYEEKQRKKRERLLDEQQQANTPAQGSK